MNASEISEVDMEKRIARFDGMRPNKMAFLDMRLPGHERDIFNMIGAGVNDDPDTKPAIPFVNGFTVTYNGCEPGMGSGLHDHETCEVFIPLTGRWSVFWGANGEHEAILDQFDVISLPVGVMRGFRNVGEDRAVLMAIIEGNDPGSVDWHPDVVAALQEAGRESDDIRDIKTND